MRSPGFLAAALVLAGAVRAMAADADDAPSVCAPPCPSDLICVGQRCVTPDLRPAPSARPAPTRPPLADPPPPPGSAPTSGPQPGGVQPPGSSPSPAPTAPAYVPPPAYPSAPPPGYTYAPPPGYAFPPPAVYAPPPPPRTKRAFLALPQLGLHSLQNQTATAYDPGLRLGAILGGRFSDRLSVDADMTFDVSNVHGLPPGDSLREWTFTLAFCPLFQTSLGRLEVLSGPKAGYYFTRAEQRTLGSLDQVRLTGFLLGLDAGAFVPVSRTTSVGLLISLEVRMPEQSCHKTMGVEICTKHTGMDSAKVFGVGAGALF